MATVATKLRKAAPRERRAVPRRPLCLEARAKFPDGSIADVAVHDLSRFGCVMESSEIASIGAALELRLTDAEAVAARVVWNSGHHFGCEFQRPLSSAIVSAALLKARPAIAAEMLPKRILYAPPEATGDTSAAPALPTGAELHVFLVFSVLLWAVLGALVVSAL